VSRRLRVTARSYLGVHEIPVKQIIGSVDRSKDLNRDFNPRHGLSARRLENLRTAFPDGDAPAIDVFEIGGAYFVEDGHHRVALAWNGTPSSSTLRSHVWRRTIKSDRTPMSASSFTPNNSASCSRKAG
jgi:hypothetical protein